MSSEKVARWLSVRLAGVVATKGFFGDCVADGVFAVGDDVPVDAGVLGTPSLVPSGSDDRSNVNGVLAVEGFEVVVCGLDGHGYRRGR